MTKTHNNKTTHYLYIFKLYTSHCLQILGSRVLINNDSGTDRWYLRYNFESTVHVVFCTTWIIQQVFMNLWLISFGLYLAIKMNFYMLFSYMLLSSNVKSLRCTNYVVICAMTTEHVYNNRRINAVYVLSCHCENDYVGRKRKDWLYAITKKNSKYP